MLDVIRARGHAAERVPLGVALERWCVAAPRPRRAGATARLVHVADLNLVKDQTTLLEAARRLAERGVVFQLDIAGRDTLGGAVANLARQCGVGDHVRFHGHLPHERLHTLVTEADLLWLSSRHEAGPLVVLEAAVVGVSHEIKGQGIVAFVTPRSGVQAGPELMEELRRHVFEMHVKRGVQHRQLCCPS